MAGETEVDFDFDGEFIQRLDAYLKGEATQAVRRGGYKNAKAFITRQVKLAVSIAENITNRQYPNAYARDERRRPIPGAPHLNDRWFFSPSSDPERGASLVNDHPKAAMLIKGFDTPSVITPKNFTENRKGVDVPILMFPRGTNGVEFVPRSRTTRTSQAVTRPVPASQRSKADNETIPYRAIRQAFRHGRRA